MSFLVSAGKISHEQGTQTLAYAHQPTKLYRQTVSIEGSMVAPEGSERKQMRMSLPSGALAGRVTVKPMHVGSSMQVAAIA